MASSRPKISICIITYNHEKYIRDCLASAIGQQVDADLEILIGDDCSQDKTRDIILEFSLRYPDLITPVLRDENVGGSQNCRDLIQRASGDYIAYLDGDDYWLPGKLAAQLSFAYAHPDCVAIYCNAAVINDAGLVTARFNRSAPEQFDLNFLTQEGNFLNNSSLMYRKEFKSQLAILQGDVIDYLVHIQLASNGVLGYVNKDLVVYRLHSSTSTSVARPEFLMNLYWDAILNAALHGADKKSLSKCIEIRLRSLIRAVLIRQRLDIALRQYKRMSLNSPLPLAPIMLRAFISLPLYLVSDLFRLAARKILSGGVQILYDR